MRQILVRSFKIVALKGLWVVFVFRLCRKACAGIQEFFGRSRQLKYVCLCETRLPPVALRLVSIGNRLSLCCGAGQEAHTCGLLITHNSWC